MKKLYYMLKLMAFLIKTMPFVRGTLLLLILIMSPTMAQPQQTFFVIGCYWDPNFTEDIHTDDQSLQRLINANFNSMVVSNLNSRNCSFSNPSQQVILAGKKYRKVNNRYILERVADVNTDINKPLYAIVTGFNEFSCRKYDPKDPQHPAGACPTVNQAIMNNYITGISAKARQFLYGYFIEDEPTGADQNSNSEIALDQTKIVESLDPQKVVYNNLGGCYVNTSELAYSNYVHKFVSSPYVTITSFDYYPFCTQNGVNTAYCKNGPTLGEGCQCNNNGYTLGYYSHGQYFVSAFIKNYEFFASEIKNERNLTPSHRVNLWGYGASIHHMGGAEIVADRIEYLRYEASAAVCYGAKGMWWFTYEQVYLNGYSSIDPTGAPTTNLTQYNNVSAVNSELAAMGPVLMRLDWEITVHGTSTDPNSGEPNLVALSSSTPVLAQFALDTEVAIGVHTHKVTGNPYLTVWNKNINSVKTTIPIVVNSQCEPKIFNVVSRDFSIKCQNVIRANNQTSFAIPSLQTGGIVLVYLDPSIPVRIRKNITNMTGQSRKK